LNDKDYVSTEEAARRLGYTPQHVRLLARTGKLSGQKIGRDWLILRESVHRRAGTKANYALDLGTPQATTDQRSEYATEESDGRTYEDILSGGEPSLAEKRLAKRLAWSNGAVPEKTRHRIFRGDARQMEQLGDEPIHLVVTSPPYFNLVDYDGATAADGQLGDIDQYDAFLDELDAVWRRCYDLLVPGGRMCVVVGDVCLSRRQSGRHHVLPLHADIGIRARRIGFDYLTPILWSKIANMATEVGGSGGFLGKPYEPNAIIKNDVEYILLLRKPGRYRKPTKAQRALSLLEPQEHSRWFRSVWTDVRGENRKAGHPAPYPSELAYRLIKMFSFVGDTVLDPFWGTGSTTLAAIEAIRSSVGFDIERTYLRIGQERLAQLSSAVVPGTLEFNF
jgi:excisionase family DNA binding protein